LFSSKAVARFWIESLGFAWAVDHVVGHRGVARGVVRRGALGMSAPVSFMVARALAG